MKVNQLRVPKVCHCNASNINPDSLVTLEEGFRRLRLSDASTPLKKYLCRRVYHLLQHRSTPMGSTLLDVVQMGMLHHDAPLGVVFPDQYAYEVFQVLYDPLLEDRHFGFEPTDSQPAVDWGDWNRLEILDPEKKYIESTSVSACRNLDGFHFTPTMSPSELMAVEDRILLTLYKLPGEYCGKYEFIRCMPPARKKELARDHCLFTCGDKYDHAANVPRFWSYGRGVFVNEAHTFIVWINAKDHMRVISQERFGDLPKAYHRIVEVMAVLDKCLRSVRHEHLGFLTVNPDSVGSGLIASVRVKLPNMPRKVLEDIAKVYHLDTQYLENDVYLLYNRGHLGYTEFQIMRDFNHGIREVLMMARFYDKKRDDDDDKHKEGGNGQGFKDDKSYENSKDLTDRKSPSTPATDEPKIAETQSETTNEIPENSGRHGNSPAPQDFIWQRTSELVMRASIRTIPSRYSYYSSYKSERKDEKLSEKDVNDRPSSNKEETRDQKLSQNIISDLFDTGLGHSSHKVTPADVYSFENRRSERNEDIDYSSVSNQNKLPRQNRRKSSIPDWFYTGVGFSSHKLTPSKVGSSDDRQEEEKEVEIEDSSSSKKEPASHQEHITLVLPSRSFHSGGNSERDIGIRHDSVSSSENIWEIRSAITAPVATGQHGNVTLDNAISRRGVSTDEGPGSSDEEASVQKQRLRTIPNDGHRGVEHSPPKITSSDIDSSDERKGKGNDIEVKANSNSEASVRKRSRSSISNWFHKGSAHSSPTFPQSVGGSSDERKEERRVDDIDGSSSTNTAKVSDPKRRRSSVPDWFYIGVGHSSPALPQSIGGSSDERKEERVNDIDGSSSTNTAKVSDPKRRRSSVPDWFYTGVGHSSPAPSQSVGGSSDERKEERRVNDIDGSSSTNTAKVSDPKRRRSSVPDWFYTGVGHSSHKSIPSVVGTTNDTKTEAKVDDVKDSSISGKHLASDQQSSIISDMFHNGLTHSYHQPSTTEANSPDDKKKNDDDNDNSSPEKEL